MNLTELIRRFKDTRENQEKAIFSTLFIAENRLQTVFDQSDPAVTLKQFMLLTMVRQSEGNQTFTQLGNLLGCSRQNIKKLAAVLEKKGFVTIAQDPEDKRASILIPTARLTAYFDQMASHHRQKLASLFQEYTDQEITQLFTLLMKLYGGIESLEAEEKGLNRKEKTDD